jgi:hypothetical protein
VNVIDSSGNPLTSTYLKRARQLVKQERAKWIAPDTVRLLEWHEEEIDLKSYEDFTAGSIGNGTVAPEAPEPVAADFLEILARRSLDAKRRIKGQIFDFALIVIFSIFQVALYDSGDKFLLAFIFLMFWGTRLLIRVIRYARPSFHKGLQAYFRERKEHKLAAEMSRLRSLDRVRINMELNR